MRGRDRFIPGVVAHIPLQAVEIVIYNSAVHQKLASPPRLAISTSPPKRGRVLIKLSIAARWFNFFDLCLCPLSRWRDKKICVAAA